MRIIILGAGASLKEGVHKGLWDAISGQDIWAINFMFKVMPFTPKAVIFQDLGVWARHKLDLLLLKDAGVKLYARPHQDLEEKVECFEQDTREFYGRAGIEKGKIYTGRMGLTGLYALSLAIAKGYDEIYLLGYDFGTPSLECDDTHCYVGLNEGSEGRPAIYRTHQGVREEVNDFENYKSSEWKIFNVSERSNITAFPKLSYDEFLKEARSWPMSHIAV